jgi:hypothetical protein
MESTERELSQPATEEVLVVAIGKEPAKPPADPLLMTALGSMGVSLLLQLFGRKTTSRFIGQWVPILLLFGLYDRISKMSDNRGEARAKAT